MSEGPERLHFPDCPQHTVSLTGPGDSTSRTLWHLLRVGVSVAAEPRFGPDPATRCQAPTFLHGPFAPGPSTAAEAAPSPTALPASPSAEPLLLSPALSCLQTQYHQEDSATSLSSAASVRRSLGPLCILCADPEEITLQTFPLHDTGLSITDGSSALADWFGFSQQSEGFTSVVLVFG